MEEERRGGRKEVKGKRIEAEAEAGSGKKTYGSENYCAFSFRRSVCSEEGNSAQMVKVAPRIVRTRKGPFQ